MWVVQNKLVKGTNYLRSSILPNIKPSKMEVAPLHRTVDITQKNLFKNTKRLKKDTKGIVWRRTSGEHHPSRLRREGHNIVFAKIGK